jgi:hypothetical protein
LKVSIDTSLFKDTKESAEAKSTHAILYYAVDTLLLKVTTRVFDMHILITQKGIFESIY